MQFFIVDAFTKKVFGGNTAGVVFMQSDDGEHRPITANFFSDEIMQKIAAQLRYSETAFVRQLGKTEFETRYFTPTGEVDLCGHATLATFHCLLREKYISGDKPVYNNTKAGRLKVEIGENGIFMQMGEPKIIAKIEDCDELYAIMNMERPEGAYPQIISTGLPDIILPVKSLQSLNAAIPDFNKLSEYSTANNAIGVHAYALEAGTVHCRDFAPAVGIDEEAATGTANGALLFGLYSALEEKPDSYQKTFIQGEAMGRPSKISGRLYNEGGRQTVYIGGNCKTFAKGIINV